MTRSIMIVGVGGQGTLLASRILGRLLMMQGHDVKLSEVHGMSQRGGSVVTYVSYGDRVCSPIIDRGEADFILSFEALEAGRWLAYLKEGGTVITNSAHILPMPVITGAAVYPEDVLDQIGAKADLIAIDAAAIAAEAGSAKAVNTVLLGVLSKKMDIPLPMWETVLRTTVPEKFVDVNLKAFALGREAAQ